MHRGGVRWRWFVWQVMVLSSRSYWPKAMRVLLAIIAPKLWCRRSVRNLGGRLARCRSTHYQGADVSRVSLRKVVWFGRAGATHNKLGRGHLRHSYRGWVALAL